MHNGETTTKKLTDAIFFWFYKPCHSAYTAVDTYRYCTAGNFRQEFNFVAFVKAIFWLN